jgi:hypothetical protein
MSDFLDAALEQDGIGQPDNPGRPRIIYSLNSSAMAAHDNVMEHWKGSFWSDQHTFLGISMVRGHMMCSMPKHFPDASTSDLVYLSLRYSGLFDPRFANVKLDFTPPTFLYKQHAYVQARGVSTDGRTIDRPCHISNMTFVISSRTDTEIAGTYGMGNDNGTFKLCRF